MNKLSNINFKKENNKNKNNNNNGDFRNFNSMYKVVSKNKYKFKKRNKSNTKKVYRYGSFTIVLNDSGELCVVCGSKKNTYSFITLLTKQQLDKYQIETYMNNMFHNELISMLNGNYKEMIKLSNASEIRKIANNNKHPVDLKKQHKLNALHVIRQNRFKQMFMINSVKDGWKYKKEYIDILKSAKWCKSHWEIPKGKVEGNESGYEAAMRENEEETGISPNMLTFTGNQYTCNFEDDGIKYEYIYYEHMLNSKGLMKYDNDSKFEIPPLSQSKAMLELCELELIPLKNNKWVKYVNKARNNSGYPNKYADNLELIFKQILQQMNKQDIYGKTIKHMKLLKHAVLNRTPPNNVSNVNIYDYLNNQWNATGLPSGTVRSIIYKTYNR